MVTTLIILALSMIFFINGKLRSDMAALCAFVSNTGAPPNLIIRETLAQAGFNDISFFSFTPVGIVCLATGLLENRRAAAFAQGINSVYSIIYGYTF